MRKVQDMDVRGRSVLVRADFNVPLTSEGAVADDTRIRATLPTLQWLCDQGVDKLVLASHLGRPNGPDPKWSLRPVVDTLSALLDLPVTLLPSDLDAALEQVHSAPPGSVLLMENTRFHSGEQRNDHELARKLARFADVFVQDAFGAVHRAHASTEGVARLLPSGAGLLLQREVQALGSLLQAPQRPFTAVIGGAKVSDKIGVIENLLPRVDRVLIGGAMANTFLLSQGHTVGKSLVEPESTDTAASLLQGEWAHKIELPVDFVVADSINDSGSAQEVPVEQVPDVQAAFDIGPATIGRYSDHVEQSATVFWNGPMGVFEVDKFAQGTYALSAAVARTEGYTVVGGGDSVAALERSGYAERVDHISTGGGASLEFLEGRTLPGIAVLDEQDA